MSDDSSGLQADGARGTDTDRLPQHYERELFVRMEEKIKFPCEPNQTSVAFLNPCRRVSDPFTSSSLESAEHKRLLHQRPMSDICIVFLFAPLIFIYIYIYFFYQSQVSSLDDYQLPCYHLFQLTLIFIWQFSHVFQQ